MSRCVFPLLYPPPESFKNDGDCFESLSLARADSGLSLHHSPSQVATFDGDTPKDDRDYIRENCNVVSGLVAPSFRFPFAFPPCSPSHLIFDRYPPPFFVCSPLSRSLRTPTCSTSPSSLARRPGAASSATSASSLSTSCILTLASSDAMLLML